MEEMDCDFVAFPLKRTVFNRVRSKTKTKVPINQSNLVGIRVQGSHNWYEFYPRVASQLLQALNFIGGDRVAALLF